PARERNPAVSPALDAVLARGLAKHPTGRYESAQALADALARALESPGTVVRPPAAPWARRRWLRRTLASAAALIVLGVGGLAAGAWWWSQGFGSIVVNTTPGGEVFIDGEFKGRTGTGPLVLPDVTVGVRAVTLKLGARTYALTGTVRRDEPLAVSHQFPEERPAPVQAREAAGKPREAPGRPPEAETTTQNKIKEALDKPRQAFEQFRGAVEKLLKSQ